LKAEAEWSALQQSACDLDNAADELLAAFPTLEKTVIVDALLTNDSRDAAIDVLLFLSKNESSYETGTNRPVAVDDHDHFPVLTDKRGWQVLPLNCKSDTDMDEKSGLEKPYLTSALKNASQAASNITDDFI
jgi:hypothetical protein